MSDRVPKVGDLYDTGTAKVRVLALHLKPSRGEPQAAMQNIETGGLAVLPIDLITNYYTLVTPADAADLDLRKMHEAALRLEADARESLAEARELLNEVCDQIHGGDLYARVSAWLARHPGSAS